MKIVCAIGVISILSTGAALGQSPPQSCDRSTFEAHYGSWGVDTSGQDRNVHPGDDFAMYAWGNWYRSAKIPPDAPAAWNRMDMRRRNQGMLRCAIEVSARTPTTENRRLIANLYRSYLNTQLTDRIGDTPLQRELTPIRKATSKREIAEEMGRANASFGAGFFKSNVGPRLDDPTRHSFRILQSGLGAGPKDFYLDEKNKQAKEAYERYAAKLLELVKWPAPQEFARKIIDVETRIAQVSWSQTESDDISAIFNVLPRAELSAFAPGFDWDAYLAGANLKGVQSVVVVQKSAIPKIAAIFADTPLETLKAWMAFHKADAAAPYLSTPYQQAHFEFWGGRQDLRQPQPRAESAIEVVSQALVHPVSREYIALYFSPQTKAAINEMVVNIKAGLRQRLISANWMGPETKKEAVAKLDALHVGIGYPDKWRDFTGLRLRDDDLYGNMEAVSRFNWAWTIGKLQRPVDRNEWILEPFALGAMAIYARNLLTFSTGFLQPPYYDPKAERAVNYGAVGAVIGHEIGHFFEPNGAKVDSTGKLRNWWTPEDAAKFQQKVDKFLSRLSSYKDDFGEPVNGPATLREQMAHYVGLEAALAGYHVSLQGRPAPIIDGYTGDQRLFLAYAQMWQGKYKQWFFTEVHEQPPMPVIINDVVRNMDGWYAAFDVRPSDKLYLKPEERIRIW